MSKDNLSSNLKPTRVNIQNPNLETRPAQPNVVAVVPPGSAHAHTADGTVVQVFDIPSGEPLNNVNSIFP